MEKENNTNNTRFKFFKAFSIWTKINIVDINSKSSDDEEKVAQYRIKWTSNS